VTSSTDALFNTSLWRFSCIQDVTFAWDQWVGCRIECAHGTYKGVSAGLGNGLRDSLESAYARFLVDREQHWSEE
jgi:uncharacterized protein YciU (UPF0263 family)